MIPPEVRAEIGARAEGLPPLDDALRAEAGRFAIAKWFDTPVEEGEFRADAIGYATVAALAVFDALVAIGDQSTTIPWGMGAFVLRLGWEPGMSVVQVLNHGRA